MNIYLSLLVFYFFWSGVFIHLIAYLLYIFEYSLLVTNVGLLMILSFDKRDICKISPKIMFKWEMN